MEQWYYADAQRQQHGPVTAEVVRDALARGELDHTSLVWRDGMASWQPLGQLLHEFALSAPQPVEPPLAPPAAPARIDPTNGAEVPPAPAQAVSTMDLRAELAASTRAATDGPKLATDDAATAGAYSPYSAPSDPLQGDVAAVVHGGDIVYAGFWKRVAAYTIDSVIVGVVGGIIAMVIGVFVGILSAGSDADGAAMILMQVFIQLISIALSAAYYAGFHASTARATLGKMAVGIKVVRLNGEGISIVRGIGRYFAAMLSGLILCIGFIMAAFTERKQGLHDMLCDTLVVDKWAFTDHPEWQRRELGVVTIVVLVLLGLMIVVGLVAIVALIGMAASLS